MKISILGTGVVAQNLSQKLLGLGHTICLGTRDVEDTLNSRTANRFSGQYFGQWLQANQGIDVQNFSIAASKGDIIINAVAGAATMSALQLIDITHLQDKILLDVSNPLDFSKGLHPPALFTSSNNSLAEMIQAHYPSVKVVKSLNTVTSNIMVNPQLIATDHVVYMSGDDQESKQQVKILLQEIGWKRIIDLGGLYTARGTEMLILHWLNLWKTLGTSDFNFSLDFPTKTLD